MSRFLSLLIFCCLSAAASADLILVQRVEGSGMEGEMTVRIKGAKVRADLAQPISTITDGDSGETLVLQHKTRTFNRITAAQTKALAEQLVKAQAATEPPKLTATGEKREILGHQAVAHLWVLGQMKIKFWVCTDFPNADAIQHQLNGIQNSGLSIVAASMMPTTVQLSGLRVRTELEVGGQKTATTMQTVKQEQVDAALFQVPPGYKEVTVPVTGAGQAP